MQFDIIKPTFEIKAEASFFPTSGISDPNSYLSDLSVLDPHPPSQRNFPILS